MRWLDVNYVPSCFIFSVDKRFQGSKHKTKAINCRIFGNIKTTFSCKFAGGEQSYLPVLETKNLVIKKEQKDCVFVCVFLDYDCSFVCKAFKTIIPYPLNYCVFLFYSLYWSHWTERTVPWSAVIWVFVTPFYVSFQCHSCRRCPESTTTAHCHQ